MKWYAAMLFLLVGFVWSVSAQEIDPKLVGTWETHDGPCEPCTLTIQANGSVSFTQAGSAIQVVFSRGTPVPGIDLVFQRGGKVSLDLKKSNALVGFYTPPDRLNSFEIVAFQRK
jgi:hypothetical protein